MLVVKRSWLGFLDIPISENLFGKNKTWRGFVFITCMNSLIVYALFNLFAFNVSSPLLLGAILGFTYPLFELPNSFLKRKIGIRPGGQHQKWGYFFMLLDKSDSAFGVCFVYWLLGNVDFCQGVLLFFICSAAHIIFSLILVRLKIKSSF